MKIYKKENVFDAGLERIRHLFDEFPNVIVGFSGGKDSTVTLQLALRVATEKNRLPLKVMFVDQEAEWQHVIDYVGSIMYDERVEPLWLQMPIRISNTTSAEEAWLYCWEDGEEANWLREKDPISIKENKYGTITFAKMFENFIEVEHPDTPTCYLAGVRAEESPNRFIGLTSQATYKDITYGKILNRAKSHYTFYPLYDWTYRDIWKAIHDNGWPYCQIYDFMYQHGYKVQDMRVSNVHHETAVKHLYYMQEIEPETWAKLTARLSGVNTAAQLKSTAFQVKELPFMFKDWREYRDYLLKNLIESEEMQKRYQERFDSMDHKYEGMKHKDDLYRAEVTTLLANDYHFVKLSNWESRPELDTFRKYKKGIINTHSMGNKYING